MDAIPSLDEIQKVVFDLDADSSLGPDGFAGFFHRHCWDTIHEEKVAFMKGRKINENISLASELVNDLQKKRKDGNVGLKLDITQASDTVSLSFVLEVFKRYGLSDSWCTWIYNILNSDRISVLVNGSLEGFFKIDRGLRQDVLSRNISKLFKEGRMTHMVSRKGVAPTHLFFADDIMIFCKENMKSLRNLMDLLGKYQIASEQTVSRQKSKLYFGGGTLTRRGCIADFLGMSVATFPNRYSGVLLMPGKGYRSFVVGFDKICSPYEEGGFGLTQLRVTNKALLMRLW
ncbi:uncharacterized protein LOC113360152 [Papaver somniferum]|uniref:uncharacterized protein LOC113360152 n=1 Tax=Papaver somniferum TaxID=3469 RepID=UPI000E700429|nr:uncharacterized protein LOC113360152 [Papaver somniferum]